MELRLSSGGALFILLLLPDHFTNRSVRTKNGQNLQNFAVIFINSCQHLIPLFAPGKQLPGAINKNKDFHVGFISFYFPLVALLLSYSLRH
jgi:hypothetical protein